MAYELAVLSLRNGFVSARGSGRERERGGGGVNEAEKQKSDKQKCSQQTHQSLGSVTAPELFSKPVSTYLQT